MEYAPEIDELKYWRGLTLLVNKKVNEAKPILVEIFKKDKNWIQVTRSLVDIDMIPKDTNVDEIIDLC